MVTLRFKEVYLLNYILWLSFLQFSLECVQPPSITHGSSNHSTKAVSPAVVGGVYVEYSCEENSTLNTSKLSVFRHWACNGNTWVDSEMSTELPQCVLGLYFK